MKLNTVEEALHHPDSILVVAGADSQVPYLSCPVRLIRCDPPTFRRLIDDLSSIEHGGEPCRLELAAPGTVFGEFDYELEASDSLTLSPYLSRIDAYIRRTIAG